MEKRSFFSRDEVVILKCFPQLEPLKRVKKTACEMEPLFFKFYSQIDGMLAGNKT